MVLGLVEKRVTGHRFRDRAGIHSFHRHALESSTLVVFFWLAALPILLFVLFISPWFIDPLFNTFQPLDIRYPALAAEIEKVVRRAGLDIPQDRVFLMEASKKTNDVNAYVTGFGASKRVVVWDTTIQKLTTDETLFIFGHEAGHYVLHHIRDGFLFFAATFLVALYVVIEACIGRWTAGAPSGKSPGPTIGHHLRCFFCCYRCWPLSLCRWPTASAAPRSTPLTSMASK